MNLSTSDVQRARFRGTRHAYDRREVDAFLERVVATLASHETALESANRELAGMKKALQQLSAARDAARRRPEVRPASVEPSLPADETEPVAVSMAEGMDVSEPNAERQRLEWLLQWVAAQEASAVAAEILAGAHEERRMIAAVAQEWRRDFMTAAEEEAAAAAAKAATAAKRRATRLVNKARREAEQTLAEAEHAREAAEQTRVEAEQSKVETELEVDEMKRRLTRLQESLAEAKDRIGHLSDATATDVAAIGDVVSLDSGAPGSGADAGHVTVVVEGADAAAEELRERLASLRRQLDED
jgi:DivIVA domain-containing protein